MKKVLVLFIVLMFTTFFVFAQDQQAPATGDAAQTDQTVEPTDESAGDQTMGAQDTVPADQTAPAPAAEPAPDQAAEGTDQSASQPTQTVSVARQKISELIGYDIVNAEGEKVGEVKDFVVTTDGKVPYATASFDDVETEGDVLVPVQAITFATTEETDQAATLSFDIQQVQGAPVVQENQLGSGWEQSAGSFWADKVEPVAADDSAAAETTTAGQAYLASQILDYDVKGSDDSSVGNVKDLMVDLESQQVAYVALGVGGFLGIGEKLFAIPMDAFQVNTEEEELALNVSQDLFEGADGFENDNWPSEVSETWQQDIESQKEALGSGEEAEGGVMTPEEPATTGADGTVGAGEATDTGVQDDTQLQTQDEASGAPAQGDQQQ